jgi:hypothetical protein
VSKRVKAWAKEARVRLLEELGPYCHWPGCRTRKRSALEFDHIHGRVWECTGLSTDQRMILYRAEASAGLLQVLCSFHNRVKGDPTSRPHWRDQWLSDLDSISYGERVEA